MQLKELFKYFDELQQIYGDNSLTPVYGAGEIKNPKVCFVFMNPTGKNISSSKSWEGLKAPWLGTKNIWKMFFELGIIEQKIFEEINFKKNNWDYKFSEKLYNYISSKKVYITNLAKCTQIDARSLKNNIFKMYLPYFFKEIELLNPDIIVTFGGQVSSIILGKNIIISNYRKKSEILKINDKSYKVFPCYYPVGQGMRNMNLAKEDINFILNNF